MPVGQIKKLNCERGFGFVTSDQGDVFFHHSSCSEDMKPLRESLTWSRVEFDVEPSERGLRAINVRPAQ